jgi:cation diffusion facilitator family transporter
MGDNKQETAVHQHPVARGLQSSLVGMAINFILAVTKGLAGIFGHSFALVADGIESLADVVSSMVVYFGLRKAIEPPDESHPYGHGKFEPIAATMVSLALAGAGAAIIFESVHEIVTPHSGPAPFTLVVLAGVLIIKESLYRYVASVANAIESTAVKSDAWHHRSDAITSGLAFIGISIALLGGPGYETADDWAALVAACIIIFNAWRQVRPALDELTDRAPTTGIEDDIRQIALSVKGVAGLDKCYVRKMGFAYYVDLHVIVDGDLSVRKGHRIAHEVKDVIRAADPRIAEVLIHVEPTTLEA